eukprot:TRINITY_DN61123_c0_g1_i1.p1 TRINITY_DN61123_c0_g1~~TRINITY_DN61123_c0_g1_i1.p1  ORF type:complete len:600 (-),score=286.35 TRINITY_DN61123_c0_g1_i1:97-1704(-)
MDDDDDDDDRASRRQQRRSDRRRRMEKRRRGSSAVEDGDDGDEEEAEEERIRKLLKGQMSGNGLTAFSDEDEDGNEQSLALTVGAGDSDSGGSSSGEYTSSDESDFEPTPGRQARFGRDPCKNVFWLLLFLSCSVAVVMVEIWDFEDDYVGAVLHSSAINVTAIVSCSLAMGAAAVTVVLWIWIPCSSTLIWSAQLASIVSVFLFSIILMALPRDEWFLGLFAFLGAAVMLVWTYRISRTNKLQFAGVLLEMVTELMHKNPGLITVAGAMLCIQTFWLLLFTIACVKSTQFEHFGLFYLFLGFAFYWTTQVFKHILHTVVAGTISHWYFEVIPREHSRRHITLMCFKRAWTTSLGSICFGSLFIATTRLLHGTCRRLASWLCCANVARMTEVLYHTWSKFSFTHVVMYGKNFRRASKDTWAMFYRRGVDSIINEDILDILLVFPAVGSGALVGTFSAVWAYAVGIQEYSYLAVVLFWVGFSSVALACEVIEACATTVFSCFAEEPQHLSDTHPLIFHRFVRISEFSLHATQFHDV